MESRSTAGGGKVLNGAPACFHQRLSDSYHFLPKIGCG